MLQGRLSTFLRRNKRRTPQFQYKSCRTICQHIICLFASVHADLMHVVYVVYVVPTSKILTPRRRHRWSLRDSRPPVFAYKTAGEVGVRSTGTLLRDESEIVFGVVTGWAKPSVRRRLRGLPRPRPFGRGRLTPYFLPCFRL